AFPHPHDLGAGLHRIVDVFQNVDAIDEVETLVTKGKVVNVRRDQGLAVLLYLAVAMRRGFEESVNQAAGVRERVAAAADIQYPIIGTEIKGDVALLIFETTFLSRPFLS